MRTIYQHRAIPCVPLAFQKSASRFLTAVTPFYKPTLTTSVRVKKRVFKNMKTVFTIYSILSR